MPLVADSLRNMSSALIIAAVVIATLVLGSDILIPLTLAAMVAFVLSPLVRGLARLGVARALAVLATVSTVSAGLVGLSAFVSGELLSLTSELENYRSNVVEKVRTVTGSASATGPITRASRAIEAMGAAIENEFSGRTKQTSQEQATGSNVIIAANDSLKNSGWDSAYALFEAASKPAAQFALTFLFAIFLLMQYQDLRDRVVRVVGTARMSDTTSAIAEAGARLSRLFLMQALINGGFGVFVGAFLWVAGVPNAALWGLLAGVMRFVPFVGSLLAAVPPLFLAAAVDQGWSLFLVTLALFAIGEPVMGNVIEPLVLGKRAGISPFAMVASVSFWTLLWGPIGLLLAAPLTTILIVLGKHIDGLELFSVLLGDEPALLPEQEFYHRLLSADSLAAISILESFKEEPSSRVAGQMLVLSSLALAANDYRLGRLEGEQIQKIATTVDDICVHTLTNAAPAPQNIECRRHVLIIAARGEIDSIAAKFAANWVRNHGDCEVLVADQTTGLTAIADAAHSPGRERPDLIVIVSAGTIRSAQLRFIEQRAAKEFGYARVVVFDVRDSDEVRDIDRTHATPVSVTHDLTELMARVSNANQDQDVDRPMPFADNPLGSSSHCATL